MTVRDAVSLLERYGPYALLFLVVAFMFWVRMIPVDRVITDSAVFYSGNDAWYHNRMVHYAVRHFPETTAFDPWSYFPYGTGRHSGFGGLFDQLIALVALVAGLGSPSDRLTDTLVALAPPAFGALTAVPTYVVARRLTDRWWGLVAAGFLALASGGILTRTMVGAADHQSAESLFAAIAVVGFVFALATAYRESPMLEDVQDRNWAFLRSTALAGVGGGVAVAAYLMLWGPGVLLVFTFGVFVVLQLVREHRAGRPTDHLAIATVVVMGTAALLTLGYAREYRLSATSYSLLQPLVAFGIAAGTAALFGLSRYAEREGYDRDLYPPMVGGLVVASLFVSWLVYPDTLDLFESLFRRAYSFGYFTSATAGTVAEIQPASPNDAFQSFGTLLFLALVGFALLVYRVVRENRPVDLLVVLWSLTMFSAYFTMARFGYYFAVNVAVMGGFAVWWVSDRWLDLAVDRLRRGEVGTYQVISVLVILMLVVPGNVVAVSGKEPVWETAERPALSGTDQTWYDGMTWMQANTPAVPMGYYEQHVEPTDGDFDYPTGVYGVMSWWDYGHWITVMGHRIPYANPFQEGQRPSSAYLQATDETRANLILEALPSDRRTETSVHEMSVTELRDVVAAQDDRASGEDGRYVVIDEEMAGGKFPAIATWAGPGQNVYFRTTPFRYQGQNVTVTSTTDRYDRTMLAKLYYDDAGGLSHYRLVHEVDQYAVIGGYVRGNRVNPLRSLGLRGGWSDVSQTASQLRRARRNDELVSIGGNQFVYDARVESQLKVYERVPGATLAGTVPDASNGTPVFALVRLETHTGRQFTYAQQTTTGPDGSFEVTVPYATDDTVGPSEGGTNVSVRAVSDYDIRVGNPLVPAANGSAGVPETAIYEGETIEVEISPVSQGETGTGSGNETAAVDPSAPASMVPVESAGP